MYHSEMQQRGHVFFPEFRGERHYMIPFLQADGLPSELKHWQRTVDEMLDGIESDQPIYFMADQSAVGLGETQRRSGLHVDGYWVPNLYAHRGSGGHRGNGGGGHRGRGRHRGSHMSGGWDVVDFSEPEALLLASNVTAARALIGDYEGPIGEGGDASLVDTTNLSSLQMHAGRVYAGTVATLHESLPVDHHCFRTLVRLNCPGVTIQ